jgi:hypothetical protein
LSRATLASRLVYDIMQRDTNKRERGNPLTEINRL